MSTMFILGLTPGNFEDKYYTPYTFPVLVDPIIFGRYTGGGASHENNLTTWLRLDFQVDLYHSLSLNTLLHQALTGVQLFNSMNRLQI